MIDYKTDIIHKMICSKVKSYTLNRQQIIEYNASQTERGFPQLTISEEKISKLKDGELLFEFMGRPAYFYDR